MRRVLHTIYEVRPRNNHRGVDLISNALPFYRMWFAEPNAVPARDVRDAQQPLT
jgi:hypothetical protein